MPGACSDGRRDDPEAGQRIDADLLGAVASGQAGQPAAASRHHEAMREAGRSGRTCSALAALSKNIRTRRRSIRVRYSARLRVHTGQELLDGHRQCAQEPVEGPGGPDRSVDIVAAQVSHTGRRRGSVAVPGAPNAPPALCSPDP
jgi:hypothetical protein